MQQPCLLSQVFWRKIKEQMRIDQTCQRKPNKQIPLTPKGDEELNVDLVKVANWSQDNRGLCSLLKKNGFATFICNQQYLYEHYKTLNLGGNKIDKVDQQTLRFINLKELDVGSNRIQCLQNIPAGVVELSASCNLIKQIRVSTPLQYLNLGHNLLGDKDLQDVRDQLPQLRHLDVSYNNICNIGGVYGLAGLKYLKSVCLVGNPISLLEHYYKTIGEAVTITHLDGVKYVKEEKKQLVKSTMQEPPTDKKDTKDKKDGKKEAKKDAKKQAKKEPQNDCPPVAQQIPKKAFNINESTLQISINVLDNVSVLVLQPQVCPNFDSNPSLYLPNYWIQYQHPTGKVSTKQNMICFDTASVEEDKARISFQHNFKHTFQPSVQLRDYFTSGLLIRVMKEEPQITIDLATQERKPVIVDQRVAKSQICVGIVFVPLESMLIQRQKTLEHRYRVFPQELLGVAELYFPVPNQQQMISNNKQRLSQLKAQKQLEAQRLLQAENLKKTNKKQPKKPQKKPPVKKGDKTQQERRVQPSLFAIHPRTYVYISDDNIVESTAMDLSVSITIRS